MDLPGRKNNLYKEDFGGLEKQIDERIIEYPDNAGSTLCYDSVANHMNFCYDKREDKGLPVRLPYKDVQLDFNVEKQVITRKMSPIIMILIGLVILFVFFNFAKRS